MTQLVLQPCSLGTPMKHFEETVLTPVALSDHADLLGAQYDQLLEVAPGGHVALWGIVPNNKLSTYHRMAVGDRALFTGQARGFYTGTVAAIFHNPDLAVRLWGRDKNGLTWEYMYALIDDAPVDIAGGTLNRAIGYQDNAAIMGFTVLDADTSAPALALIDASLSQAQVPVLVINPPTREVRGRRGLAQLADPSAVLAAIREYDRLGQEAFLQKYGFGPARTFHLIHDSKVYDSKAIAGAAMGYQPGVERALLASEFSGGEAGAAGRLRALGFTVRGSDDAVPGRQVTREAVLAAIAEYDRVGREAFLQTLGASPSQRYVVVHDGVEYDAKPLIQFAWAHDHPDREPLAAGDFRGDRRTVAEPLRALDFWVIRIDGPSTADDAPLGQDPARYLAAAAQLEGSLDRPTSGSARQEQDLLRGALGLLQEGASDCALCGRHLPNELLRAAHIKPRSKCSREERLQLLSIAMPACLLGCDSLFETGWLGVDDTGHVITARDTLTIPALAKYAEELVGLTTPAWNPGTRPFFAWHVQHVVDLRGKGQESPSTSPNG